MYDVHAFMVNACINHASSLLYYDQQNKDCYHAFCSEKKPSIPKPVFMYDLLIGKEVFFNADLVYYTEQKTPEFCILYNDFLSFACLFYDSGSYLNVFMQNTLIVDDIL